MIVCHCQGISDHDIRAAVTWMRASDPDTVITSGRIYRALGKRADCGGCMPLFIATLRETPAFQVPGQPPGATLPFRQLINNRRPKRKPKPSGAPECRKLIF